MAFARAAAGSIHVAPFQHSFSLTQSVDGVPGAYPTDANGQTWHHDVPTALHSIPHIALGVGLPAPLPRPFALPTAANSANVVSKAAKSQKVTVHDPLPKLRALTDSEDLEDELPALPELPAKRGRPSGSGNYTEGDVKALLRIVEAELPLGARGWQVVHANFTKWARKHNRPKRQLKSLETKYKQLVRTPKPTGKGVCPPNIKKAHEIETLISERAGTRQLNDSEFEGGGEEPNEPVELSSDSGEDLVPDPKLVVARITRPDAGRQQTRNNRARGVEILEKLSQTLDPSIQQARDEQRADRSFKNTSFLILSQQLRDAQGMVESLRSQLSSLQTRFHAAETSRERAELRFEIMQMSMQARRQPKYFAPPIPTPSRRKVRTKRKHEEWRPDGSGSIQWLTDTDTGDSDKENFH